MSTASFSESCSTYAADAFAGGDEWLGCLLRPARRYPTATRPVTEERGARPRGEDHHHYRYLDYCYLDHLLGHLSQIHRSGKGRGTDR